MNSAEFVDLLNTKGSYDTPTDLRYGPFSGLDIHFYLKLCGIIGRCKKAFEKDFSVDNWKIQAYDAFSMVESCRGIIHVSGIENLRKAKPPFVYIANHMSLIETFLLPIMVLDVSNIAIILKEDLMKYPVFGKLLSSLDPIRVTRKNPKEDLHTVMKQGQRVLQEEKRSILVFPQSTRTADFDPSDFNSLGVKLAQRNNVPCVPIALKTDFLAPGRIVRDIGRIDRSKHIHFKFGEPVIPTRANSREVHDGIADFIAGSLKEWKT